MSYAPADEKALILDLHSPDIKNNLYNFVMYAYPWGAKDTPFEREHGPRTWQKEDLDELTGHILEQEARVAQGLTPVMWKKATASGRGTGKSARLGWFAHWMATTRIGSTTIVTANTEPQLKTKTFAEISKWVQCAINAHWFEVSTLAVRPAPWFGQLVREQLKIDTGYYYIQGQLWSEESPDSFVGAHNPLGVLLLMDEGAGIPTPIFTVSQGFFTEPVVDRYWEVYSQARRNSGGFYDCFHDDPPTWRLRHLDARTVEGLDQQIFTDMIAKHGIESDVVAMEILGQFPKQGNRQFISNELVHAAQRREVVEDLGAPLILGVDIARYGNAATVFRFRRGRDARSIAPIKFTERDNMFIANKLVEIANHYKPDAINIDAGNGTGVIDRVRELGLRVTEVWFGSSATSREWANKRTEMYADLRDWLGGGCIDADPRLFTDLTAPEYHPHGKASDQTMLQSKEDLMAMGFDPPDDGDAIVLTFANKVARRDTRQYVHANRSRTARDFDYPLFGT